MHKVQDDNQKQELSNGDSKISTNKFSKTLTSFHTKNEFPKNTNQQNTMRKPGQIKTDKSSKTKRVYFSSKKKNNLGYIITNPLSPTNNDKFKGIYNKNPIRTSNIPNSAKRSYDYKNGFILNNINKYQTNIINNNKRNSNKSSSINDKKNKNNSSNNNSKNTSKKTNGASINNNSLIRSTDNFLNTIAITLTNNENNINGGLYTYKYNKSLSNLNEFSNFNARNKIMKKIKDKNDNQNKLKEIKNQNKKNCFKKANTNTKLKSNISKNVNKSLSNKNNNSNSVSNSNNNTNKNPNNEKIENKNISNELKDESVKFDFLDQKIINNNRRSYNNFNNINRYDIYYQTLENNNLNEDIVKDEYNFQTSTYNNNDIIINNPITDLNLNKILKISKDNFNDEKDKNQEIIKNDYNNYNTFLKNHMIKVNVIDKDESYNKKSDNNNIPNDENINHEKGIYIKNKLIKNEDLFNNNKGKNKIKDNEANKIITEQNSERKNQILMENYSPRKKNMFINNLNIKKQKNLNNPNKNNYPIYPLSKEYNQAYVKKKSPGSSLNKLKNNKQSNNGNPSFLSNKNSVFVKYSKNNSVSNSISINKTQRNSENNKNSIYIKNKEDKANYLYSSKNNSVGKIVPNKSIVVPEYTIKLENIKSRVSNLLNVYSLLALRSLNDTNDKKIDNTSNINNKK